MSGDGDPPASEPRRQPASPALRWGLAGGVALFVVLLVTVTASRRGPDLPPRTVHDQEFVRRANAACGRVLPPLREDRQRRARGSGDEAAVRRSMERAADELERLAGEVRAIPVAADDQADVERWLADWDAYIDVGRRFADALGRRDDDSYGALAAESSRLSERIFVFSQVNGMRECVF